MRQTLNRNIALSALAGGTQAAEDLADHLYEADDWIHIGQARAVARRLCQHGAARELASGEFKITARGRGILRDWRKA